jgi:hypothetical protein
MLDGAHHANDHTGESASSAPAARPSGDDAMAKVLAAARRAPLVPMTEQEATDLAVNDDGDDTPSDDFLMWLATQAPAA